MQRATPADPFTGGNAVHIIPVLNAAQLYNEIAKPMYEGTGDIPEGYNRLGVTQADIDAFMKDATRHDIKWLPWYEELLWFFYYKYHCNVPQGFITPCGEKLGIWVNNQRQAVRKDMLKAERRAQLIALGCTL